VTPAAFKSSLEDGVPPRETIPALAALWWIKKGDWDRAHEIVMSDDSRDAAWVHALLHRIEGDESNAGYWYRQAQKPAANGSTDAEWEAIADALLAT
jgi:hypothetical protein